MIANARMYSIGPATRLAWRELFAALAGRAGVELDVIDHLPPAPLEELWRRPDLGAVFMCGLPFALASPGGPVPLAAPVPRGPEFEDASVYWSELVVRKASAFQRLEDTFGGRLALTVRDSQSGSAALLKLLMNSPGPQPRYGEVIAPQLTPLAAANAVAAGGADLAAIDAYAWRLMGRFCPEVTDALRVIGRTPGTPMPLLVASAAGFEPLQAALLGAHQDSGTLALMERLLLARFVAPDAQAYDVMRTDFEQSMRYWREHALASIVHPAFLV